MTEDRPFIVRTEVLTPGPAVGFARLFEVEPPDLETEGLPLLWHWFYLLDRPRRSDLGADGHPVRDVIPAPPEPGRRRMFAGGRVTRHGPLVVGREATRRTEIVSTTDKQGRSGRLTFVVVRHTISQDGGVRVVEEQDIVYRDAAGGGPPAEVTPVTPIPLGDDEWSVPVDPVLLFRFSALTYNGHRIHYDRDYARQVEGYPGLVTHGPLQAMAMAEFVRRAGATPTSIDFRLVSPLFEHEGLVVSATGSGATRAATVRDLGGRVTAKSRITIADSDEDPQKTEGTR